MGQVLAVTSPIYLLIATGFLAVRLGVMQATEMRVLGRFVVLFAVPALLLRATARQPLAEVLRIEFLAVYLAASLATWAVTFLVARRLRRRGLSLSAIEAMGASMSNSAFVGYPIVEQVLGPVAGIALAMAFLVENLVMMTLSFAVADAQDSKGSVLSTLGAVLAGLLRNPMILAIIAGMALALSGIGLPALLERPVGMVATAAAPVALIVIGGSLVGLRMDGAMAGDIAVVTTGKLVLHPVLVLALLQVIPVGPLGRSGLADAAVLLSAMPMLSIYPVLAQRYGHERFCAATLLVTTIASFFTINALLAMLRAAA